MRLRVLRLPKFLFCSSAFFLWFTGLSGTSCAPTTRVYTFYACKIRCPLKSLANDIRRLNSRQSTYNPLARHDSDLSHVTGAIDAFMSGLHRRLEARARLRALLPLGNQACSCFSFEKRRALLLRQFDSPLKPLPRPFLWLGQAE